MSSETIELPPPVYQSLMDAARENGQTPVDWIAARLPQPLHGTSAATAAEIADANAQLRAHRILSTPNTSTDNAGIDADLVRTYADEPAE